jgi:hypothetical protein
MFSIANGRVEEPDKGTDLLCGLDTHSCNPRPSEFSLFTGKADSMKQKSGLLLKKLSQTASIAILLPLLFTIVPLSRSLSQTQTTPSGFAPMLPSASAAAYYYIAKPGELTMLVNIWGYVQKPGRYEVPSSTDLVQLVSYAGGPAEYADMEEVNLTRAVRVDKKISKKTYVFNLEKLESLSDDDLKLYPGDTIFIGSTGWVTTRDALLVITAAALVVTAVAQVILVSR